MCFSKEPPELWSCHEQYVRRCNLSVSKEFWYILLGMVAVAVLVAAAMVTFFWSRVCVVRRMEHVKRAKNSTHSKQVMAAAAEADKAERKNRKQKQREIKQKQKALRNAVTPSSNGSPVAPLLARKVEQAQAPPQSTEAEQAQAPSDEPFNSDGNSEDSGNAGRQMQHMSSSFI